MGHAGHEHVNAAAASASDRRWLLVAAGVVVAFMAGEVTVGLMVGSLALLSDAGHMLSDAAALILAAVAIGVAKRPARGAFTYGFARVDSLSGQASGITLVLLAIWFAFEGIQRLIDPPDVPGLPVIITAAVGIVVNLIATWCASRASQEGLNVRGAIAHLLTDVWAFGATLAAGVVIAVTGWTRADPAATLIVAVLMLWTGWALIRDSGRVFLEASPAGIDPARVGADLAGIEGVAQVHDLHVWDLGSGEPALSAHIQVVPDRDCHAVTSVVRATLAADYGISHATLQSEHVETTGTSVTEDESCAIGHGPVHTAGGGAVAR